MATQKGYVIHKRRRESGYSYTVRIWSTKTKKYISTKTFKSWEYKSSRDALRDANAYGQQMRLKVKAELIEESDWKHKPLLTKPLIDQYIKHLLSLEQDAKNVYDLKRRLERLPEFMPHLNTEDVRKNALKWWEAWREEPCRRGYMKPNGEKVYYATTTPKSNRTKNKGLTDLKAFVNWCWDYNDVTSLKQEINLKWIKPLKIPDKIKKQFTIEELKKGLQTTITSRDGSTKPHPYVIRWALYIYLGARLSEIFYLKWTDFEGNQVTISGKNNKERLTPIQFELIDILKNYKSAIGNKFNGYLFPERLRPTDKNGKKKRSSSSIKNFNSFLKKAKIPKEKRTTHSLRHCYAGLMTATGEPTSLIQTYMGHSQSDMTHHYAKNAVRYREEVKDWKRGAIQLIN